MMAWKGPRRLVARRSVHTEGMGLMGFGEVFGGDLGQPRAWLPAADIHP
jgi:hypothetical protein